MFANAWLANLLWVTIIVSHVDLANAASKGSSMSLARRCELAAEVRQMFYHAYDNYMMNAFPKDELQPLACTGVTSFFNGSLTLIDALDMLIILDNKSEFFRQMEWLVKHLPTARTTGHLSLFETTIRVVGGLLSAHLVATEQYEDYDGELLALAQDQVDRLAVAFSPANGVPFNKFMFLQEDVQRIAVQPIATAAGSGTLVLEFAILSFLTKNFKTGMVVGKVSRESFFQEAIWGTKSRLNLLGSALNMQSLTWMDRNAQIGGGSDSFYEYLLKCYVLLGDQNCWERWQEAYAAVEQRIKRRLDKRSSKDNKEEERDEEESEDPCPWHVKVDLETGEVRQWTVNGLQAFWPGLQTLAGDVDGALESFFSYYCATYNFGFVPEEFDDQTLTVPQYYLRPEFIESVYYLYRATKDPFFLELGEQFLRRLQKLTKVPCGYSALKHVLTKERQDQMDSFFLSETLKYLYLLFDDQNTTKLHEAFVFSTEGHPFPITSELQDFHAQCVVAGNTPASARKGKLSPTTKSKASKKPKRSAKVSATPQCPTGWWEVDPLGANVNTAQERALEDGVVSKVLTCKALNISVGMARLKTGRCFAKAPYQRPSTWHIFKDSDPFVRHAMTLPAFESRLTKRRDYRNIFAKQANAHSLQAILPGTVIISHPSHPFDIMFGRSVVIIYKNDAEGTLGLILNKKLVEGQEEFISSHYPWLAEGIQSHKIPRNAFIGGPVPMLPTILHSCEAARNLFTFTSFDAQDEETAPSTATKFYISAPLEPAQVKQLERLLDQSFCSYRKFFYVSSWAPIQLWGELLRPIGGWLTATLSTAMLQLTFEDRFSHEEFWAECLYHMGGTFRNLSRLHFDKKFFALPM